MGIFDKIKNALFEVEYVEVEEKPKKEKKSKPTEKADAIIDEKPIAKKIVLPGKREEKIEQIQEEELIDQDFEARPKDEMIKENANSSFMFMDDSDFQVEEEPQIIQNIEPEVEVLSDDNSPMVDKTVPKIEINTAYSGVSPIENVEAYSTMNNAYKVKPRESRPYGMDPSYHVSIKEYGSYDNKDDKAYFKPSPIISPIYGILDKNYKKEDVVQKKDIRITTNYTRSNVNVDDVRNKAYGVHVEPAKEDVVEAEPVEEENLLVDLSDEKEKPEVKEITVGDAMEYFQDLGLEYNVDYVDASNKNAPKKKNDDLEKEIEDNLSEEEVVEEKKEKVEELAPSHEDKKVVEVVNESKDDNEATLSDDDNLFDLIDSMYKEDR